MKYICNPLNIEYKYQFIKNQDGSINISREAADPSLVLFKDTYYLYPSMSCGFWYSDDLVDWKFHPTKNLPSYDYAPDVRVVDDYIYFCASNHNYGVFYRTKDPFTDEYERIEGEFPFWDPNQFQDEDGRLYFYYGCSPSQPIYGVELDKETLKPLGEKVPLFKNDEEHIGYERRGEDHIPDRSKEEIAAILKAMETQDIPEDKKQQALDYVMGKGYIEGAWMTKRNGKYYLQYAAAGSQFNIYGDGVYMSDNPLGPFALAKNNPYSYKPGGFMPGAGHGSTLKDKEGKYWHISTMRISYNQVFERRLGLWPAGFDEDGELYCSQAYGDWVYDLDKQRENPFCEPEWMLLSYGKSVSASSCEEGYSVQSVTDENVRTWWKAKGKEKEWIEVDLGKEYDVRAIQINFADDKLDITLPEDTKFTGDIYNSRWIDEVNQRTRWILEGSLDKESYFMVEDKSNVDTDLSHDLIIKEEGFNVRYLKLTILEIPYNQIPCISGLRIFGNSEGELPKQVDKVNAKRVSPLDAKVSWESDEAGYVVYWGHEENKLYHSYLTYKNEVNIGSLIDGQELYIRVDSFNETGIIHGEVKKVED